MKRIHHRRLPDHSTLLSGGGEMPDEYGFRSPRLQVWYNNTADEWADEQAHAHLECDECFIVTRGVIVVDVEGEELRIGPREYCYFPIGVFHRIVRVEPPVESFMIRAPSVKDKVYR